MTTNRALTFVFALALSTERVAQAQTYPDWVDEDRVEVLEAARPCAAPPGSLCLSPAFSSTRVEPWMPSLYVIVPDWRAPSGIRRKCVAAGTPVITHVAVLAALGRIPSLVDAPWNVQVDTHLLRRAWKGNALFLVYDAEDQGAVERREVTTLWQAPLAASEHLSARLTLSPDDGFHPDHSYRLRIVQLIQGREVLLADGELRLR